MTIRPFIAVLLMFGSPLMTRAQQKTDVAHGTINEIFANQNGIVALTDSMVTSGSRQLSDPAQKLFQLDDHTVCTIAGFLAAGAKPDVFIDTRAIIHEFVKQLAMNKPQTIREKLTSLAFLFDMDISVIGTLRASTGQSTEVQNYESVVTVAGYDTDGVPRVGQVTLVTTQSGDTLTSEVRDWEITEIGKAFVYKLAGETEIAEHLLSDPDAEPNDEVLVSYAKALKRDGGQSLTISQMKEIASRVAIYTHDEFRGVGGADQVAILQGGHVTSVNQGPFPTPPKALVSFFVMENSRISAPPGHPGFPPASEGLIAFPPGRTLLFLRTTFDNVYRKLDGNYFYADTFNNCFLLYDGGPFYFDKNNVVVHTTLILGAQVNVKDPKVQALIHDFQWLHE